MINAKSEYRHCPVFKNILEHFSDYMNVIDHLKLVNTACFKYL